jgi:hypothetical protein
MATLFDEVKKHRHQIKYDTISFSVSELVNMYTAQPQEIKIQPVYQRLFRWEREQQSSFIESLILEIPVPPIFFFENVDGTWELLDGLQRVSTILKFVAANGDVPEAYQGPEHDDENWHYENQNNLEVPLQLVAGEYLTQLRGLTYTRLPTALQLNLKRSRLHLYVLKRETHNIYKYEVFKRLNRGGARLTDQEVRNCSIRLLSNRTAQYIEELGRDSGFVGIVGAKKPQLQKRETEELALRYLAMRNSPEEFRHDLGPFLDNYMEKLAASEMTFDFKAEKETFLRTVKVIEQALPDGKAFRQKSEEGRYLGPFSPAVFEMVMIAVSFNLDSYESAAHEKVKVRLEELITTAKKQGLTGAGSNSRKKTLGRVVLAKGWDCP